jgi:exonuclease SbcC
MAVPEISLRPEEVRRRYEELVAQFGEKASADVERDLAEVERDIAGGEARRAELERRMRALEEELTRFDEAALREEGEIRRRTMERAEKLISRWMGRTKELAEKWGVEADQSATRSLIGELKERERQLLRLVRGVPEVKEEIRRRKDLLEDLRKKIKERYLDVKAVAPSAPAWSTALSSEDYKALGKKLKEEHENLGGEEVKRELEKVQGLLSRKRGEKATREEKWGDLIGRAQELAAKLGMEGALSASPAPEEVEGLLSELRAMELPERMALSEKRDELLREAGYLRERKEKLESELGLRGELLDEEECRREVEGKRREINVRNRAVDILKMTKRRMMEMVLPNTMEYMRRLLPVLTMDRYYDAELTEDYHIKVWDERAGEIGAWKMKNIFSGGTKDQFSLALRLAFALATLPAERGAAPSFIFLDEPLGSFDQERARKLLYLLVEGEIARSFDQIFLISHVQVDPGLFDYHITLDDGRVVESDLPQFT